MIKDWRGVEIQVGDIVVYPGRHSSSLWMVEGEVVELLPGRPDAEDYWDRNPHGVKVRRLFDSGNWPYHKVEVQRVVPVQANNVTVVEPRSSS